ncbi:hypothetical protein BC936DRAFT_145483 [Jimgerdemannia flammicorona]|uniref:Major facilitator superfamily (MFS) profile domain-containing protein n=1 Tax=Jimgerdemannia flammicorona TaxID=994334 RepID=A0A433D9W2_9FUNG|nr:hypothetical protein BC936DRAFT_145483 [Jimgerdemannia flammicorona]
MYFIPRLWPTRRGSLLPHRHRGFPFRSHRQYMYVDYTWRIVTGLGAIPAIIAFYYRLTIPETPRYTIDVANKVSQGVQDASAWLETAAARGNYEDVDIIEKASRLLERFRDLFSASGRTRNFCSRHHFTGLRWICLWHRPQQYQDFDGYQHRRQYGAALRRFHVEGVACPAIHARSTLPKFGPNATTFIYPGEMFPTRYRSTCHGISAASDVLAAGDEQVT